MNKSQRFNRLVKERNVLESSINMILLYKYRYNLKNNLDGLLDIFRSELSRIEREIRRMAEKEVIV